MGRNLKDSIKIIKARAARANAARNRGDDPELVDELVDAGLVKRGATEVPEGSNRDVADTENGDRDGLERFKEGEPAPIESIEPGEERLAGDSPFYLIRRVGEALDPSATLEAATFGGLNGWPAHVGAKVHGGQVPGQKMDVEFTRDRVCFLDIETTGLSPTTYLFLIGLMFWEKSDFVAELVFARNYAEETAVLRYVRDTLARFDSVVTYNGDRFDLPFIETRLATTRVEPLEPFASVDLLYTARRVFRGVLPNCRLGTVERHLRGIDRTGDIPGRYIPEAYHDYVRTNDARAMRNVLYHNRMDLFTMAILINRLATSAPSEP
jgi:uncharacterized protein YprB with RNaseH-like and TPR domain